MHIRLPDRQCCQLFSSTSLSFSQNKVFQFYVSCSSSAVIHYYIVFHKVPSIAGSSNFTMAVDITGFFLPVGLVQDFDYFSL